jgi:lysophospholipase L1-like esterase
MPSPQHQLPEKMNQFIAIAGLAAILAAAGAATAQDVTPVVASAPPAASPWEDTFAAFAASDRRAPPPEGGVLFVGSSSIRMWNGLEGEFEARPVVLKRGFGGSKLSDCVQNLERLVIRYRPRAVLVYAGDNDLAGGSMPEEVLRRFAAFVEGVHHELPGTRIDYISIKPSPARRALLPRIRVTNALIRTYVEQHPDLAYIDVYTPMLDSEGQPRGELFREDALHLNAAGYALWKSVIAPYVQLASQ